jgi:hypothetical protein
VLAWTGVGIGVAGAATFVATTLLASTRYEQFQVHKTALDRGIEVEPVCDTTAVKGVPAVCDHRASAGYYKAQVETFQAISWIGLAAAGAGAIGATVLFVVGDPPGKYEAYRQRTGVVSMQLSPAPGGLVLTGAF